MTDIDQFIATQALAAANMNSGNRLYSQGRSAEAASDYGQAIDLLEGLRAELKPDGGGPPTLINTLAAAYSNRGAAFASEGRLAEALVDYGQAIELGEGMRAELASMGQWTHELRNDLAAAYNNRGNSLRRQGRFTEAVADFEQAIDIREGLRAAASSSGRWISELGNDLAAAYSNRGAAFSCQGRLGDASADFEQAVKLREMLRAELAPLGEWTPELIGDLAGAYNNQGTAFADQGRLVEAVEAYGQSINLGLRAALKPKEQWTLALRNDLAGYYSNRAVALAAQGQLSEAVEDYGQAIEFREGLRAAAESAGNWTPQLREDLAATYMNRGAARRAQGQDRLEDAVSDYGQAIRLREWLREAMEPVGQWTPALINSLAKAYSNRGNAHVATGHLDDAVSDFGQAIALRELLRETPKPAGQWTLALRNSLAIAYSNRGVALDLQGRPGEALADFERSIALGEELRAELEPRVQWLPLMVNNLAGFYMNRGCNLLGQGLLSEAAAAYERALALNESLPDGILSEADRTRFGIYCNLALLLDHISEPKRWARATSQRMADFLEQLLTTDAEQSPAPQLYQDFHLFHARWLAWCTRNEELDVIPEILSIIQGRELAAENWIEKIDPEDPRTPQDVRAYRQLRCDLRRLRASIEAVIIRSRATGDADRPWHGHAHVLNSESDDNRYPALLVKHQHLVDRISSLRQAVARLPGYEYIALRNLSVTLGALRGSLAANEGLLLLIDPPEGESGLLLVRPECVPHWQAVPELPALVLAIRAFNDWTPRDWAALDMDERKWQQDARSASISHPRLGGYRHGKFESGEDDSDRLTRMREQIQTLIESLGDVGEHIVDACGQRERFWPTMNDSMARFLWSVLVPHLVGIDNLIVIPHGKLHLLPLSAGKPKGMQLNRFPGLFFFAERRWLYGPYDTSGPDKHSVGLVGFAGEYGDIPLAEAEAAVLENLYRAHGRLARPSAYPYTAEEEGLLHIACHGVDDPDNPDRVALLISTPLVGDDSENENRHVLNQNAVIASSSTPIDLYFSACLGGQTIEDLSGTPSGLISACFRRHARWVAGALVQIPDLWSMLLAVLTHQAILVEGWPLPRALAEGKRRLAAGDWFADTGAQLQAALREPLRRLAASGVAALWDHLAWTYDEQDRRDQFAEQAIPALLNGWGLTAEEIAELHQRLRHHGPETLAEPLATALAELWPSRPRIPPEPHLGTLIHGVVVFGEAG